jgi:HAD superfamily hydrolase (TIGR01459 family)
MRRIAGLGEIARDFDAMIVDQFGVIHDGRALYPGAAQALANVHQAGIPVVIVSNSGKRTASNVKRIVKMGIAREHFVDCISSGEVAWASLRVKTAYLIGKRGEDYGFDPIRFVTDPAQAEVVLILGSNAPETSMSDYETLLAGMTLPAVCCNPDKLMITADGLQPAPGAIAALYEAMGRSVTWIGKPFRGIYDHALGRLGHPRRVLCIGDSAEHDVAGGRNAGLSTLLVQQGVSAHVDEGLLQPHSDFIAKEFKWSA